LLQGIKNNRRAQENAGIVSIIILQAFADFSENDNLASQHPCAKVSVAKKLGRQARIHIPLTASLIC
jgi:hypothetical protein